ncbi:YbjC family protein [Escherichia coli]|nr:YbjC family protein [Escherichia coli]
MRAIGKLPKGVLILEFIGMMLLAVALLSVSDSLSLPEPFSRRPEVQILMIFLGVLLMLPAAVVVILQVAKRLAPQLMNRPPQYSRSEREKDNDANH